eukprot:s2110_g5.t3
MLAGRSRDWSISTEGCSWSSGDVHQGDPAVDPRVSASGVSCGDLCKPGLGVERLRDYPGNPASADEAAGDASRRQIQAIKPMQRPTAPKGGGKGTCHNCIPAPAEEDPAGRPAGAEGTEGPTSPAADKAQLEEAMKAQSDEAKVRNEKDCGPSWGRVGDYRASAPSFWSWPCFFGWTSARRTRPRPSRGWGNRPATPSFADAGSNSDTPRPKMASRTSGPMDFAPKTRLARQEVEEEGGSREPRASRLAKPLRATIGLFSVSKGQMQWRILELDALYSEEPQPNCTCPKCAGHPVAKGPLSFPGSGRRKNATFDDDGAWNWVGFGPWGCLDSTDDWCFHSYHVGGECGQGLFYDLFYRADQVFWTALEAEPSTVRPLGVMLDGCIWLYENSVRVAGFPTVPNPCPDMVAQHRCGNIVAYHKVIEGRGCAASPELLGASAASSLRLYPSDAADSLYNTHTSPTFQSEMEPKKFASQKPPSSGRTRNALWHLSEAMAPKKGKKDKEQKDAAAVAPASVNLSPAMAELLNKKIREFEKSSAEENEKSQKAQKGKARTAAKNKLKEVKQIATGTAPDAEKIQQLIQRLEAEDEEAMSLGQDVETRTKELTDVEDKADSAQAELSKCLATKSKLESLLRQLQQQTNTLNEERRKLTDAERQRRSGG